MTKVGITSNPPLGSSTSELAPPPTRSMRPGAVLADKYRIERVLGQGGMGVVVAAWHLQLERTVAIKLIRPEWAHDPSAVQRMLREAKALASLNSEHAARVIDVGTSEDGLPFIVMEYLEGSDLETVLRRDGPLDTAESVDFLLQACEAIAEAHRNHIVHRDLKPANLFVVKQPGGVASIKVVDFGISKLINARAVDTLTRPSGIVGSLHHMAPEQMRAGTVDARTDVWALGAVLFEMLTGLKPFPETAWPALCSDLLPPPLPLLDALPESVPEEVMNCMRRCLNRAPEDRYANVAELAVVLSPFGGRSARTSLERIVRLATSTGSLAANSFWSPPSPRPAAVAPIARAFEEEALETEEQEASEAAAVEESADEQSADEQSAVEEPADEQSVITNSAVGSRAANDLVAPVHAKARVAQAEPESDALVPANDPGGTDADPAADADPDAAATPEQLAVARQARRRRQIRELVGAAVAGFLLLVVVPVLCVSQTYELKDPSRRGADPSEGALSTATTQLPTTLAPTATPPASAPIVPAPAAAPRSAPATPRQPPQAPLSRATGALQPAATPPASATPGPKVAPVLPRTPVVAPIPAIAASPAASPSKPVPAKPVPSAAPKVAAAETHGTFDIIRTLPADMAAAPKPNDPARRDGAERPAPPRTAPNGEAPAEDKSPAPKRGTNAWNLKDLEFE